MLNSLPLLFRNNSCGCVCEAVIPEPQWVSQKQPGDGSTEDCNLRFLSLCSATAPGTLLSAPNHRWNDCEQQKQMNPPVQGGCLSQRKQNFVLTKVFSAIISASTIILTFVLLFCWVFLFCFVLKCAYYNRQCHLFMWFIMSSFAFNKTHNPWHVIIFLKKTCCIHHKCILLL